MFVPAGSSDEFAAQMFEAAVYAMQDPDVQEQINALGMELWPSASPEEFIEFITAEQVRLGAAARRYSIAVD